MSKSKKRRRHRGAADQQNSRAGRAATSNATAPSLKSRRASAPAPPPWTRALHIGLWLCLLLLLLVPFVISPPTFFPYIVGRAIYARILIEVMFVLWVALALFDARFRPPRSWILGLLAIGLVVSALSTGFGVSPQRSAWSTYERMQGWVDQAHWLAFVVIAASVVRLGEWRALLQVNLAVSLLVAFLAIGQQLSMQWIPFFDHLTSMSGRFSGSMPNPSFLGVYAVVNCIIALGFLAHSFIARDAKASKHAGGSRLDPATWPPWAARSFFIAAAILNAWALIITASRGSLLGLFVGIGSAVAVYVGLHWLRRRKSGTARDVHLVAVGLIAGVGLVAATLFWVAFEADASFEAALAAERAAAVEPSGAAIPGSESGAATSRDPTSPDAIPSRSMLERLLAADWSKTLRNRVAVWRAGWQGFLERPVLGWGPDNFVVVFGRYISGRLGIGLEVHDHAHSKMVEELVTKGLLGLLAFFAVWLLVLHVSVRGAVAALPQSASSDGGGLSRDTGLLALFVGAALVGIFVHGLTAPYSTTTTMLTMLLFAFVARLEAAMRPSEQERDAETTKPAASSSPAMRGGVRAAAILAAAGLAAASLVIHQRIASDSVTTRILVGSLGAAQSTHHERRVNFEHALAGFEPMTLFPRLTLFQYMEVAWNPLRLHNPSEARKLLAMMESQIPVALAMEPENWQITIALAKAYALIAASDAKYRPKAEAYRERTLELAPNRTW